MRILLSNDDGIAEPGLAELHRAVSDLGELTVVAPASPQSAAGQAITVASPMVVQEVHVREGPIEFVGLSVEGRPADCVRLAIRKLMDPAPDLVLSGINSGANVGIHVYYSGTVAAAAEGALCGIPAVAFSAALTSGEFDFARIACLCRWVLDGLLDGGLTGGDLINVNIPALALGVPKGICAVRQSDANVIERYHGQTDAQGRQTYQLSEYEFAHGGGQTDVDCLQDGYVTVTPLHVDRTDRERMAALGQCCWGPPPR